MKVEKALEIALRAHGGQRDRDNLPVILHPLRVGLQGSTEIEIVAGFLHDVVEDSEMTFKDLEQEGAEPELLEVLDLLTHDESMTYEEYIDRIILSRNETAKSVKLNDLLDNIYRAERTGWRMLQEKHKDAATRLLSGFTYKKSKK